MYVGDSGVLLPCLWVECYLLDVKFICVYLVHCCILKSQYFLANNAFFFNSTLSDKTP